MSRLILLLPLFLLIGCSTIQPRELARTRPLFRPETYFTGRLEAQGFFETRSGQPHATFTNQSHGHREGATLVLQQHIVSSSGQVQERTWRIRPVSPGRYEGTANDVIGTAHGEVNGATFHWKYTLALQPGNALSHVHLEQWLTLQQDGRTVLNRGVVRKAGVRVAMLSEVFRRQP